MFVVAFTKVEVFKDKVVLPHLHSMKRNAAYCTMSSYHSLFQANDIVVGSVCHFNKQTFDRHPPTVATFINLGALGRNYLNVRH